MEYHIFQNLKTSLTILVTIEPFPDSNLQGLRVLKFDKGFSGSKQKLQSNEVQMRNSGFEKKNVRKGNIQLFDGRTT